jgi:hypothetical protein
MILFKKSKRLNENLNFLDLYLLSSKKKSNRIIHNNLK